MESITTENTKVVRDILENAIKEVKDEVYIRYEKDDTIYDITYDEFGKLARKMGAFVNDKKVEFGRQVKVGVIGNASANYFTLIVGVMGSGNVIVPMDQQLDLTHLADLLNRSDVDILFYDWDYQPLLKDLKELCPKVKYYYTMEKMKDDNSDTDTDTDKDTDTLSIKDIFENPRYTGMEWSVEKEEKLPSVDDLAMILFTSGTTGRSKGVMLTQGNLIGNVLDQIPMDDDTDKAVLLLVLPMHHVYCINSDVFAIMYRGGMVCINGPMALMGKHLQMFQPNEIHMVPMIAKVLYNKIKSIVKAHPGVTEAQALRMVYGKKIARIICGGGGLSEELAQSYLDMGIKIGQGYGMSEHSPMISVPLLDRKDKIFSAGLLLRHVEVRNGENGELQIRSPFVMKGYYGEEELTKEAFTDDGWLRTGDIGYVDEERYLYLTGRIKNLIILSNGENVSPEEIEADFDTELLIKDIIVFHENDIIKCEVYPDMAYAETAGIQDVLEEVKKIVSRHNNDLPSYKRIMQTSIRKQPFKKTTSNKIIRKAFFDERKATNETEANVLQPQNEAQQKIYDALADCLGHKKFGIDSDFYSIGLDSFGSVMLLSSLHNKYNFSLTLSELMDHATVEKLTDFWEEKQKQAALVDYTPREKYDLIENQVHMMNTMTVNSTATLPYLFKLDDSIDMDRMEEAFKKLLQYHPIVFSKVEPDLDGKIYLFRRPVAEPKIERMKNVSLADWEEKKKTLIVVWDYEDKPGDDLYRAGLYETEDGGKYLFLEFSHLIGDGTSMKLIFEDLSNFYLGKAMPEQTYDFYDYMVDEHEKEVNGEYEKDTQFYQEVLKNFELSRATLARKDGYDLDHPVNAEFQGRFTKIDQKLVKDYCHTHGISENALFLTAFSYTLSIFSDMDDVAITSIYNGRTDGRWARLLGQLFIWYPFRYTKVKNESVEDLLKKGTGKIMNTMKTHMCVRPVDDLLVQYQGDLLDIPEIGGQKAIMENLDMDSTPFHLMIFSDSYGYPYQLWYGANRFDGELLKIFFAAMEDVAVGLLKETDVSQVAGHISSELYPKHVSLTAKDLNASLEQTVIAGDEERKVKPYVLDENGKKKPFGAWGKLYILDQPVHSGHGSGGSKSQKMDSLYTPGTLYDTGIIARIMPNNTVESLTQAGRLVCREVLEGRFYIDLNKLEETLKSYDDVEEAKCAMVYGDKNRFYIKADITVTESVHEEKLKKYVEEKLGASQTPEILNIKEKKTSFKNIVNMIKNKKLNTRTLKNYFLSFVLDK